MAIEPVGSIMSLQAQNIQPPKASQQETVSPEDKDVAAAKAAEAQMPDPQTLSVSRTEPKDGKDSKDSKEGKGEAQGARPQEQQPNLSSELIRKTVDKLRKSINNGDEEAVFGIHEGTNRVTIKIVERNSKKVVKELPPEKTLDMIAKMWEIAGIMVDEKR